MAFYQTSGSLDTGQLMGNVSNTNLNGFTDELLSLVYSGWKIQSIYYDGSDHIGILYFPTK